MRLNSFRIKRFRSILDTEWCDLSRDNITGLIGQNESGKTAILEAMYAFDSKKISEDDLRIAEEFPEISLSFFSNETELDEIFKDKSLPTKTKGVLKKKSYRINLTRTWTAIDQSNLIIEDKELFDSFEEQEIQSTEAAQPVQEGTSLPPAIIPLISRDEFAQTFYENTPSLVLFEDFGSLLPNTISLEDLQNKNKEAEGYWGAQNFLTIAGIDISSINSSLRETETKIEEANDKITKGFQKFWRQEIGKEKKIKIEFSLKNRDSSAGENAGKPYLVFWISDGKSKLFPKQRSQGVRWFLSFYLQLQASSIVEAESSEIYLIDEPGASLHVRAQEDVLQLFNSLRDNLQVIYTTHSPFLIKGETLYRLLAVQRKDIEDDKSETRVFSPTELGSASTDTLSPLYTSIGADFSSQQVIKKNNNVILEEISAFYYFSAFNLLVKNQKEINFLPATGTSNIPQLAYLFLGWGIDFTIAVDDDSSGKQVYNELKKNLFKDDETQANRKMTKITGCNGIEDIFTKNDFRKFVLRKVTISYSVSNSEYMKTSGKSKQIFALEFMLAVKAKKVKLTELSNDSQKNIKEIIKELSSKL